MFDGAGFPKSLDEEQFDNWLEEGRLSKLSYHFMLIIWDEADMVYKPVYAESRDKISQYEPYGESTGRESLIAAYDLYSESRIG
ncbi:hypothetical protein [Marinigracilibium pacificum]|uniref:Uncharacterized protein n=1 Tax=Marinigracilibium pacificum TaxID=2729599 RepID=A0A848J343_9BACT|nr:hypothetical protein [Marinigracilibium pacificum]NMM49925.1 hypothetical protein [Marinigracilibium pacificum]